MKILVVDDEPFIRRMIKITLESRAYNVIESQNGKDAAVKAISDKPDVILLDIMMPVHDGFYGLEKIKENPETSYIPVIMLTSMGRTQDINKAIAIGAAGYVMKPFEYDDLISAIEKAVNKDPK